MLREKISILLVEDEALIAMMEKVDLENKGYIVHLSGSGENAVKTITDDQLGIDLILMDIDLGRGIDGTIAAEQILNRREIPVVFLSSHIESEVVIKTEKITSYGYVVKNSGIMVLDASIKMAIKLFNEKTERKRAEDQLRESEERFKALHNASFGGISIHDKGIIWECNQGLSEMTGYLREELIGMDGLLLVAPDSRDLVMHNILSGYEKSYEAVGLRKNGEQFPMRLEARNVPYKGKQVRTVEFRDISDNKWAKEALRKSESIAKKMVANIGDVIVIIDKNGNNSYKSPNVETLFGWKPEELIGKSTWRNLHPDDVEAGKKFINSLSKEHGAKGTAEVRYKPKTGDYVWVEITVVNFLNDPDIQGFLGNYHEITERKKTEDALRFEQLLSKTMLDSLPGIFYLYSYPELRLLKWNRNHETLLGFSAEEMKNCHITEWHIPEVKDTIIPACDYVMKEGQISIEARLLTKSGERIPYLLTGNRFEMNDKFYILGIGIDITERKKIEEQILNSEARYRELLTNLDAGVIVHAADTSILLYNDNASKLLGLSGDQIKGRDSTDPHWLFLNENGTPMLLENYPVHQIVRNRLPIKNFIVGIKRPAASDIDWGSVNGFPVFDENGCIKEIVISFSDITARKYAEEEIQKQLAEKGILLKEVHHRVKNNIASIESLLLLQSGSTNNLEVKTALQDAAARVNSMRVLYEKLLLGEDYSDVSMKNYTESLIDSVVSVFAKGSNITIEKNISEITITSKNAITVGIIINELLTNVFKYAFKDRNSGHVLVSIEKSGNLVTLVIHDNGVCADERFYSNKINGFGLTIVKMLADQLKGAYTVTNENGTRSVLKFNI